MKVLLVDDDPDDIELFREAVKRIDTNIHIITANTAKEGLQLILRHTEDLSFIFIDINMPVMNGIEFLEALQAYPLSGTCLVMYTTSGSPDEIAKCKSLGADYIIKPYLFDHLVQRLKSTFSKEGSR